MNVIRCDLAIVGSGFSGSILAMIARRLGLSVVLLERGRHPRFAIGESTTPLTNLLLEELADEFDLPFLRGVAKWGAWQREHPDLPCGLKRGFTFYQHELGQPFPTDRAASLRRQLMVGASPNEHVADTHWYRPAFDHWLVREAQALGVDYRDETEITDFAAEPAGVRLAGSRAGEAFSVAAGFFVDASGPRGFLQRALRLPEKTVPGLPATQALFAHFAEVGRLPAHFVPGEPPYPPEQAAVHHVFPGGWIWILRFNHGLVSAGVAATDPVADRFGLREGEPGWRRLLAALPSLAPAFAGSRVVAPFVWQPRLAFHSDVVTGPGWARLPSATGIVDPLLSTGFPLTLLGVQRLGRLLRDRASSDFTAGLSAYADATTREFEAAAGLVGALYARMDHFDEFKTLSLLYFAAAAYAETARRLGKPGLVPNFLLCGHPAFGPQLRELCALPPGDPSLAGRVHAAIAPFDVASLGDATRDPWYPALAADLFRHAGKVGATEPEIAAMLARCGLGSAAARC